MTSKLILKNHGGHLKNWYTGKNITGVGQMKGHIPTTRINKHLNEFNLLARSKAGTFNAMQLDSISMAPTIKQHLHFLSAGTRCNQFCLLMICQGLADQKHLGSR